MATRVSGTLEKYCLTPGKAEAYIRVGEELLHVTMVSRGVLQADKSISPCVNGHRYEPLAGVKKVELDVDIHERLSPHVIAWAPKAAT